MSTSQPTDGNKNHTKMSNYQFDVKIITTTITTTKIINITNTPHKTRNLESIIGLIKWQQLKFNSQTLWNLMSLSCCFYSLVLSLPLSLYLPLNLGVWALFCGSFVFVLLTALGSATECQCSLIITSNVTLWFHCSIRTNAHYQHIFGRLSMSLRGYRSHRRTARNQMSLHANIARTFILCLFLICFRIARLRICSVPFIIQFSRSFLFVFEPKLIADLKFSLVSRSLKTQHNINWDLTNEYTQWIAYKWAAAKATQ